MSLPGSTQISGLELKVADVSKTADFYRSLLSFETVHEEPSKIDLTTSPLRTAHVVLTEDSAADRFPEAPGLFHVAFLYPSRRELAVAFKRLYDHGWPFQGFADHGVSEALYLADPEGNGIELYADRPRETWVYQNGLIQMKTDRLDLKSLMQELENPLGSQSPTGVAIGHIHLQVSDLARAENFYHGLAGFDVTQKNYPGALFLSAGGYHHHIGLNTWNSRGVTKPKGETLGLVRYEIDVRERKVLDDLKQRLRVSTIEETDRSVLARDQDGLHVEFHLS